MSTTPAFSPGPCNTCGPRVGRRRRCTLLDLYEQCSLHITLKMPSSVKFGSRARIFWMRAYSSAVRPCSAASSGVTLISVSNICFAEDMMKVQVAQPLLAVCFCSLSQKLHSQEWLCYLSRNHGAARERFDQRAKNHETVVRAKRHFHCAFRMRHQAQHVAFAIAYSRDVRERAVRIGRSFLVPVRCRITKYDLVVALKLGKGRVITIIISFAMVDRESQHLAGLCRTRERRVRVFNPNVYLSADEPQPSIAHKHARQQARLTKNLKAVADPEDEPSGAREFFHRAHHRRKSRDRPRAQVIAISKSAGQQNRVKPIHFFGLMPEEFDRLTEHFAQRVPGVVIATRARKHDHTEFQLPESSLEDILSQRAAILPLRQRNLKPARNRGPGALDLTRKFLA